MVFMVWTPKSRTFRPLQLSLRGTALSNIPTAFSIVLNTLLSCVCRGLLGESSSSDEDEDNSDVANAESDEVNSPSHHTLLHHADFALLPF